MKKNIVLFFLLISNLFFAQVRVKGIVTDTSGNPIPYATIVLKNSSIGEITDEKGTFYIESTNSYPALIVSFLGYETKTIPLTKTNNYDLNIVLKDEASSLDEVVIYSGKQKVKGNPAIDILKKIWAKKKKNGVYLHKQYQYDKYEKIEFDMNNIDSTLMKSRIFKGMEFVFDHIDTSRVTGKSFLPIFINEAFYKTYGLNKPTTKFKEDLQANKNSGFQGNQYVISFVKDLYVEYDIYDNYIKLFNKSFTSPLSKTGVNTYNYVLADSTFIEGKWCYNIVYYPRRTGTLTFKGDFWVNDTTFAVKEINMEASKSANINWIKDLYIEQKYEVLSDSIFLLKKDYIQSDFSLTKKEKSRGFYGKRTTLYNNYNFDIPKDIAFYDVVSDVYADSIHNKSDSYWKENRFEKLNKNEEGVYSMLDTLNTVPKFKRMYNLASILATGYISFNKFDFGPVFSSVGVNDIEGWRLRVGGRTYFGPNDLWRIQGYTAYGLKDKKFKYGVSWKWMFRKKNRWILELGKRRDLEQIGVSLTTSNDVMGRSFASSAFLASGPSDQLTNVNLSTISLAANLKKNLEIKVGSSYKTLKPPGSGDFNLNYIDSEGNIQTNTNELEASISLEYTPKRKTVGAGVELKNVNSNFPTLFLSYSKGFKFNKSDFDYYKAQFYYSQPFQIGGLGASKVTLEAGKTFGKVPLGLLSVVPGNQSYFTISNTFGLLNYYEFVTDTYTTLKFKHNFNGRIFNRIPLLKKLNLREIVGVRSVWGSVSQENKDLNKSNVIYKTPEDIYIEYSAGIGNILKVFKIEFLWRGTYLDVPGSHNFGVKGSFGFSF
ncbi:DUF5686 and carboxypeptidase-like regulatory domain-containing protein [Flavicella sediminum]|uniref:DUF5686 and carboxypeptidase-like regulatory domain-containing protein n=1 Tax=Flavicella sediminum TaxID=2585141 RepID=UPI00111F7E09|nr:DUF5686 and carboxypeptidase-like regulatory domain-containing protein [Flavicella sediminum]